MGTSQRYRTIITCSKCDMRVDIDFEHEVNLNALLGGMRASHSQRCTGRILRSDPPEEEYVKPLWMRVVSKMKIFRPS